MYRNQLRDPNAPLTGKDFLDPNLVKDPVVLAARQRWFAREETRFRRISAYPMEHPVDFRDIQYGMVMHHLEEFEAAQKAILSQRNTPLPEFNPNGPIFDTFKISLVEASPATRIDIFRGEAFDNIKRGIGYKGQVDAITPETATEFDPASFQLHETYASGERTGIMFTSVAPYGRLETPNGELWAPAVRKVFVRGIAPYFTLALAHQGPKEPYWYLQK